MRARGAMLLALGVCLLSPPAQSKEKGPEPLQPERLADWIAKARVGRLTLELEHVAMEIRDGLLFSAGKVAPVVEQLTAEPKGTCEDNARRICEAFARVSPSFGKAWRLYVEGDCPGALDALQPIISVRDTTYFAAAKRFVQAQAFVGTAEYTAATDGYLDLVRDMPSRFSLASLALIRAGETFETMHRRYYAMALYRLWVETFGLMDDEMAARLTARADRIEADYVDPLQTIAAKMDEVADRLGASDSGEANQQTQQEILEQLDDIIALLEEQDQDRKPPPMTAAAVVDPPRRPRGAVAAGKIRPSDMSDAWGLLPPKERERLMATFTESIPERYREMIREYFARVAKAGAGRGQR